MVGRRLGSLRSRGHATDSDVEQGRVRLEDQLGNAEADTAADPGRRHQSEVIVNAWRSLLKVRTHWYPITQRLHQVHDCRFLGLWFIMMGKGVLPLTHLYGTLGEEEGSCVGQILGFILFLPLFLNRMVF